MKATFNIGICGVCNLYYNRNLYVWMSWMSVTISILRFSVICYPIVFPLKVHFSIPTLLNANFGLCCRLLCFEYLERLGLPSCRKSFTFDLYAGKILCWWWWLFYWGKLRTYGPWSTCEHVLVILWNLCNNTSFYSLRQELII